MVQDIVLSLVTIYSYSYNTAVHGSLQIIDWLHLNTSANMWKVQELCYQPKFSWLYLAGHETKLVGWTTHKLLPCRFCLLFLNYWTTVGTPSGITDLSLGWHHTNPWKTYQNGIETSLVWRQLQVKGQQCQTNKQWKVWHRSGATTSTPTHLLG